MQVSRHLAFLGFILFSQSKLSESKKKLVKPKITKLEFEEVKTQLKTVCNHGGNIKGNEN